MGDIKSIPYVSVLQNGWVKFIWLKAIGLVFLLQEKMLLEGESVYELNRGKVWNLASCHENHKIKSK